MAGALSPDDGCGFNTTVVAGVTPAGGRELEYTTSIVDTGEDDPAINDNYPFTVRVPIL